MSSRKCSYIWTTFTDIGDCKAKCNICSHIIKMSKGSTGNLSRHLKLNHPTVDTTRSYFNEPNTTIDHLNNNPCPTVTQNKGEISTNSGSSPAISVVAIEMPIQPSISISNSVPGSSLSTKPIYSISNSQTRLTSFVTKPIPQSRSKMLDHQLVRVVTKEYHPLSIVEDKEFKTFITMLNPGYSLPSRKTLSTNLIPQQYKRVSEMVQSDISQATGVSLTFDSWTSIANENYIAITAHYIGESGDMKSSLLECVENSQSHTAVNLSEELNKCVEKWGIRNKIVAVVSDNAANVKAAITLCGWRNIPCFAHTVNLIVQNGIEVISQIKTKGKAIVEYFKKSPQAYNKLNNMQKQMNCKELRLKQEVPTRWNSCLYMFERLLEIKEPLISTLALINPQLNSLSEADWDIIREACELLKLFEEITVEMSSQKNVTLSKVMVLSKSMLNHVQEIKQNTNNPEIDEMCDKMIEQIKKRFKDVDNDFLLRESTILDPRIKKYGFKNDDSYNRAYRRVSEKASSIVIADLHPVEDETEEEPSAKKSKAWGDFDESVKHVLANDNPTAAAIIELDNNTLVTVSFQGLRIP